MHQPDVPHQIVDVAAPAPQRDRRDTPIFDVSIIQNISDDQAAAFVLGVDGYGSGVGL